MATKKWFGLAAVVATIGGAVAYVLTKVKESPDKAAEVYGGIMEKAKESPEKAGAKVDAAKEKFQRLDDEAGAEAEPEKETAST
jgi:hypothetical protein